jgi:putative phosphoribosyl transferase
VRPYCDEIVCLETPRSFYAVGQFYRDFPQISDDEVVALLSPRSSD